MMRLWKDLKKQKGSALVLVMLTFVVVAIIGSAVVSISLGEVKQSVALDKDMRAYYKARSASDATMKWIAHQVETIASMTVENADQEAEYNALVDELDKVVPVGEGDIRQGNLTGIDGVDGVDVWREGDYIYTKAKATVYGESAAAIVRLNQNPPEDSFYLVEEVTVIPPTHNTSGLFSDAIYACGDILMGGSSSEVRDGDVRYEGNINYSGSPDFDNEPVKSDTPKDFLDWNPPVFEGSRTWSSSMNASASGLYPNVNNLSGNTTINTQGQDVILHVEHMNVKKAQITATGTGRVFLYIDDLTYSGLNANLSIISSKTKPNVYLIFDKNVAFDYDLEGGNQMQCYIYAPNHDITFKGNVEIYGAVICQDFHSQGTIKVQYIAPDLEEEDINDGSDEETTETNTITVTYERQGSVGSDGIQWLGE